MGRHRDFPLLVKQYDSKRMIVMLLVERISLCTGNGASAILDFWQI